MSRAIKVFLALLVFALLYLYAALGDQAHRDYASLHIVSEHGGYISYAPDYDYRRYGLAKRGEAK